jgi:hypothetical protein
MRRRSGECYEIISAPHSKIHQPLLRHYHACTGPTPTKALRQTHGVAALESPTASIFPVQTTSNKNASHEADWRITPAELRSTGCRFPTPVTGQNFRALLQQPASSIPLFPLCSVVADEARSGLALSTEPSNTKPTTQDCGKRSFFVSILLQSTFLVKPRSATSAQRSHRRLQSGFPQFSGRH